MAGSDARARAVEDAAEREFVISRVFDAPRKLVFEAWTEPKHMMRWWGPRTVTNPVCEMDVRPGGAYRITMRDANGEDYPIKGFFRGVVRPERLVMTMDCSEHSQKWHDMVCPNHPAGDKNPVGEILCTVTFEEEAGKTRVTVRQRFASVEIRNAMLKLGMNDGWSESFDKLAELLVVRGEKA
jgi:uncharacterized protein YndB with AHSA1/START domain